MFDFSFCFCQSLKMTDKLTRREREKIIFNHLKGQPDPLYDVQETSNGKYVVSLKKIEIEEEEEKPEAEPKQSKQQVKRERRRQNRRAKADAYRILEQLNRLLNVNDEESNDDEEPADVGYDKPKAPPIIEQSNYNPGPLSFKRKRLRF